MNTKKALFITRLALYVCTSPLTAQEWLKQPSIEILNHLQETSGINYKNADTHDAKQYWRTYNLVVCMLTRKIAQQESFSSKAIQEALKKELNFLDKNNPQRSKIKHSIQNSIQEIWRI